MLFPYKYSVAMMQEYEPYVQECVHAQCYSITLFSYRYGDVRAFTIAEDWYSIFAMLAGIAVYFGMLLGGLTSIMTNSDQPLGQFSHRFKVIKDHLVRSCCLIFLSVS